MADAADVTGTHDDGLLLEYVQCNEFYNSRDFIAGDLFTKLIQSFSAFTAILVALKLIGKLPSVLHISIILVLGVFGAVSFVSLLLDIQGACSVKVAARLRAQEIESELAGRGGPGIWTRVEVRDRFWEERLMKAARMEEDGAPSTVQAPEKETEGVLFVFAGRMAVVLWVVLTVIAVITA